MTRSKIQAIINEIDSNFFERRNVVKACWLAILSSQNLLMLGPPGTGKSYLINTICTHIKDVNYFQWLLTRFSTPEEIFGPISLKGLENDEYRRITNNKLPEANLAFCDEIFKANSAILNSMLTIVNEHAFDNGSTRINVPIISMFGASNELPEAEELDALYDRFILRFWLPYIKEASNWHKFIFNGTIMTTQTNNLITLDELKTAQNDVTKVKLPSTIIDTMRDIKMTLEREGVVASDRRWKQTVRIFQAHAWLDNRDEIIEQDLELLCDMLWKEPEQRIILVSKVLSVTNPLDLEATKYYDDCLEVFSNFSPSVGEATKTEIAQKLKLALEKIDITLKIADPNKTKKIKSVQGNIKTWYKSVIEAIEL